MPWATESPTLTPVASAGAGTQESLDESGASAREMGPAGSSLSGTMPPWAQALKRRA